MTVPPDDLFGASATDPTDELASALLDEGRAATDADLDAAVAARLRAITTARRALRDVPPPDPARREQAIAAALAAFGEPAFSEPAFGEPAFGEPAIGEPATGVPDAGGAGRAAGGATVVGIERAPSARRARVSPQRLLAAAAVVAAVGLGAVAVSRSGDHKASGSAAGSFASRSAVSTTAAAASASPAAADALGAGGGTEADTSAAAATTAAASGAITTAATTAAATAASASTPPAPGATAAKNGADLPSLGAVGDVVQLRRRLGAIASLEPSTTIAGATAPSTVAPSRTTISIDGATVVAATADCTAKGAVIATLTWQDVAAYVVRDERGYAVVDATDCHEIVRP